jgi:hypothetical protein
MRTPTFGRGSHSRQSRSVYGRPAVDGPAATRPRATRSRRSAQVGDTPRWRPSEVRPALRRRPPPVQLPVAALTPAPKRSSVGNCRAACVVEQRGLGRAGRRHHAIPSRVVCEREGDGYARVLGLFRLLRGRRRGARRSGAAPPAGAQDLSPGCQAVNSDSSLDGLHRGAGWFIPRNLAAGEVLAARAGPPTQGGTPSTVALSVNEVPVETVEFPGTVRYVFTVAAPYTARWSLDASADATWNVGCLREVQPPGASAGAPAGPRRSWEPPGPTGSAAQAVSRSSSAAAGTTASGAVAATT